MLPFVLLGVWSPGVLVRREQRADGPEPGARAPGRHHLRLRLIVSQILGTTRLSALLLTGCGTVNLGSQASSANSSGAPTGTATSSSTGVTGSGTGTGTSGVARSSTTSGSTSGSAGTSTFPCNGEQCAATAVCESSVCDSSAACLAPPLDAGCEEDLSCDCIFDAGFFNAYCRPVSNLLQCTEDGGGLYLYCDSSC